jgi:hypothetical protein
MSDMPKMKTLTINGTTFEVVDETARTDSGKIFVGNYDTTTYAEIKAAHDAGKLCFLNDEGLMLPLLNLSDTEAIFIREFNEHTDYKVTFTSSGGKDFTLVEKNTPLVVTLSGNDTDGYTADKTVADINAARNAGRDIYMVGGILTYQLCYLSSSFASFTYTRASGTALEVFSVVMMDGSATVRFQQTIDDSYVKYTEQSLPAEYKLQARTNIGALSAGDVDTVLQQAKDSGQFDGPAGPAGPAGPTGATGPQGPAGPTGATGKTAYAYAQDGGYTGTETEFAEKLAESNDVVIVSITGDDTNGYTSDKTVSEIQAALDDGKMVLAKVGNNAYAVLSYLLRDFSAVFTSSTSSNGRFSIVSYTIMEMFGNKVDKGTFDTDAYEMPADYVTAGTFAGQVVANASGQDAGTSLLRNSKLVSADTDPTVNGEICWTYE